MKKCSRCRGTGLIMVQGMREPTRCPLCAGTGKIGETKMTTTKTDGTKVRELMYLEQSAHGGALELIDQFIETYEYSLRELRRHRERMVNAIEESKRSKITRGDKHSASPVEILSWTVGSLRSAPSNLRIDMACGVSAMLSAAANMRGQLEKEGAL